MAAGFLFLLRMLIDRIYALFDGFSLRFCPSGKSSRSQGAFAPPRINARPKNVISAVFCYLGERKTALRRRPKEGKRN